MNDKLKEMLKEMKTGIETGKDKYGIKVDGACYTWKDLKMLLDYITNLQQDLSNYVNVVLHDRKVIDDYKSRIEKAVEYVENDDNFWVALCEDCGKPNDDLDKLLNILNGRSDE